MTRRPLTENERRALVQVSNGYLLMLAGSLILIVVSNVIAPTPEVRLIAALVLGTVVAVVAVLNIRVMYWLARGLRVPEHQNGDHP